MSVERRRQMIELDHPVLSIARQCVLVSISRSSFYYSPTGENPLNLMLMRLIDEAFLECPFYGSRQMARHLRRQGYVVGRKRVSRSRGRTRSGAPGRSDAAGGTSPHPDAARLPLPGGDHGLGHQEGAVVAALQHDGGRLLHRGAGGGLGALRRTGDLQYGSG
jgi:hypothetical protein